MQKITTLFLIFAMAFSLMAVEKIVLAEMATATWCTNCPIAYQALDNVAANHPGALLKCRYYNDSDFGSQAVSDRLGFYGVHSYPTTYFDGEFFEQGTANSDVSALTAIYENLFQQAYAEGTPIAIEISALNIQSGTATIQVTAETAVDEALLNVYWLIVEDGLTHSGHSYDDVCRVVEEVGTLSNLAAGESQTFTANFTWDGEWNESNCQAIAFVQSTISKDVWQAASTALVPAENAPVQWQNEVNLQNYPNPFNPETTIRFQIVDAHNAQLSIYNVKGELVKAFSALQQGENVVQWNGRNEAGAQVGSGVYFYQLQADGQRVAKKMVLMK